MIIGKLNKRINFIQNKEHINSLGQTVQAEEVVKTAWATIKAIRGKEFWDAQKIRSEQTYKITTRYFGFVNSKMKIEYKGRIFEILYVNNVNEENRMLEIIAQERE